MIHEIRAVYDYETIRVYQAYSDPIANAALAAGTFVSPFSMTRMTWIKPSFLWMMYRAGWGQKDESQKRMLAVDIQRTGFEWALRNSSPSHGPSLDKSKPVRVQWDPERTIELEKLPYRSIQIGLSGDAVRHYVDDWIVSIEDVSELAEQVRMTRDVAFVPRERPYPLNPELAAIVGVTPA